jgi:hypothetical protein
MNVCVYACMHACMYVCVYVCVYVCIRRTTFVNLKKNILANGIFMYTMKHDMRVWVHVYMQKEKDINIEYKKDQCAFIHACIRGNV